MQLNGIIEMDSTYFKKPFKGQKAFLKDDLDDMSYGVFVKKKQRVSEQKLCVSCIIDRQNDVFCKYVSNGKVTSKKLISVYKNCFNFNILETVIIDEENGYKTSLKKLNIPTKVLIKSKGMPKYIPIIDGIYHLQHVDQLHEYLKFHIEDKYMDC